MKVKATRFIPALLLLAAAAAAYAQASYRTPQAAEVTRYMSPKCASMRDALTPSATRGLSYESVSSLQQAYARECGKDEAQASSRVYQEQAEKSRQQGADFLANRKEQERAAQREQQCAESRRILTNKKARTDLTPGEKDDLARFETNYRARCLPG